MELYIKNTTNTNHNTIEELKLFYVQNFNIEN